MQGCTLHVTRKKEQKISTFSGKNEKVTLNSGTAIFTAPVTMSLSTKSLSECHSLDTRKEDGVLL
jgi:hypothetical protein